MLRSIIDPASRWSILSARDDRTCGRMQIEKRSRWITVRRLGPSALALLACLLVASTWHVFGNVWDEPEHLAAGLSLLDQGDYRYDNQHPPLARLAAALGPHLAGARLASDASPSGEQAGRDILYHSSASYDTLLTLARSGMLPFLLLLVIAQWYWVRESFAEPVAWLSTLFLLCTPPILGHAGVVALDVPVTALCVLSFWLLQRWVAAPTLRRSLALGLAAGLAVSTKISAIPFLGLGGLVLLAAQLLVSRSASQAGASARAPLSGRALLSGCARYGAGALLAILLAAVICVAVYGPNLVYFPALGMRVPLGVQEMTLNIRGVEFHNAHGHPAYLLGETDLMGWWYFYPVALAVKTTIPMLLLGLPGLAWLTLRGWRARQLGMMAPGLLFAALLVFCCLYSHINIGVRHVLVLYPLLAIGAGAAALALWKNLGAPLARALAAVLVLWQFSTLLTAYPDYLAWFNAFAGAHPERILVDSDLDWGQDLRRLSQELARRQVPEVHIAYRGTADLSREHLPPYSLLPPNQQVSGWIALDMLSLKESNGGYDWLAHYQPLQRIGKSIDLYYLPTR
jgi:hypothetical protein